MLDIELSEKLQFGNLYLDLAKQNAKKNEYIKPEEYIKEKDIDFTQLAAKYSFYSELENPQSKNYLSEIKNRVSYVEKKMGKALVKSLNSI